MWCKYAYFLTLFSIPRSYANRNIIDGQTQYFVPVVYERIGGSGNGVIKMIDVIATAAMQSHERSKAAFKSYATATLSVSLQRANSKCVCLAQFPNRFNEAPVIIQSMGE